MIVKQFRYVIGSSSELVSLYSLKVRALLWKMDHTNMAKKKKKKECIATRGKWGGEGRGGGEWRGGMELSCLR